MIVGVLTTFHTQYTLDRSIFIFYLIEQHSQVFVTYIIGALYVHPLWFYKHQHDNRVRSKLYHVSGDGFNGGSDYRVDVCRITKGAHIEHL